MSDDLFLLYIFCIALSLVLGILAFFADWLTQHPSSWLTRKLDRVLQQLGI